MAIKSKDELLKFLKEKTKDDTSDETLGFIEDVTDTFNDYDSKVKDQTNWKQKYEDNDREWREKYKERFFSSDDTNDKDNDLDLDDTEDEKKPKTFKDLFTFTK